MAYEFLKKLFGTPKDGEAPKAMTYAELEAAIDADKKIKVVDIKAGGYVAKESFDTKERHGIGYIIRKQRWIFGDIQGGSQIRRMRKEHESKSEEAPVRDGAHVWREVEDI